MMLKALNASALRYLADLKQCSSSQSTMRFLTQNEKLYIAKDYEYLPYYFGGGIEVGC